MRKTHFIVFIWIFVITNSCVHHKITFGDKHQKKADSEISESSANQVENDSQLEQPLTPTETNSKEPVERLFDFVENKIDQKGAEKIIENSKTFIQKTEAKNNLDKGSNDSKSNRNENNEGGTALTIIGVLMLLLGIVIVFLSLNQINNNQSTFDGCVTSVIVGTMLLIVGIAIGTIGLVLIVTGLVFFAAEK